MSNRNLTDDQRLMLRNYITQYNQANNQINYLYGVLTDIRNNINAINQQILHQRPNANPNSTPNANPISVPYPIPNSRPIVTPNANQNRQRQQRSSIFDNYDLNIFNIPLNSNSSRLLTPQEIEEATLTTTFSNIALPINTECPIRLEEFNANDVVTQIRHCGHIFNSDELNNWFIANNRCPVCRRDVRNSLNQQHGNSIDDYSTTLINGLLNGILSEITIVRDASNNIINTTTNTTNTTNTSNTSNAFNNTNNSNNSNNSNNY